MFLVPRFTRSDVVLASDYNNKALSYLIGTLIIRHHLAWLKTSHFCNLSQWYPPTSFLFSSFVHRTISHAIYSYNRSSYGLVCTCSNHLNQFSVIYPSKMLNQSLYQIVIPYYVLSYMTIYIHLNILIYAICSDSLGWLPRVIQRQLCLVSGD